MTYECGKFEVICNYLNKVNGCNETDEELAKHRADNSLVANVLFAKPIDAENYINTMHNIMLYKSDVIIIPVFVVE